MDNIQIRKALADSLGMVVDQIIAELGERSCVIVEQPVLPVHYGWRCPNMRDHLDFADGEFVVVNAPCPDCYSTEETVKRIPFRADSVATGIKRVVTR